MMLIGFGFLMTFIKFGSWQALSYTFCINAIVVQYYLLWSSFWTKVMMNRWGETTVYVKENNFTAASYSVASILIAFGAVLGRVGPYQLLLMAMIQIIFYALNEVICYELIHIYDVGGSTVIHTFGAYFGLGVSLILGIFKKPGPDVKVEQNKNSVTFAVIGTFFLWMFWPSFNAGFFPQAAQ
jgi:ammonium transporter Rh